MFLSIFSHLHSVFLSQRPTLERFIYIHQPICQWMVFVHLLVWHSVFVCIFGKLLCCVQVLMGKSDTWKFDNKTPDMFSVRKFKLYDNKEQIHKLLWTTDIPSRITYLQAFFNICFWIWTAWLFSHEQLYVIFFLVCVCFLLCVAVTQWTTWSTYTEQSQDMLYSLVLLFLCFPCFSDLFFQENIICFVIRLPFFSQEKGNL